MALSIKDPETDALVRKLARRRRTSFTGAIRLAVSNELAKDEKPKKDIVKIRAAVAEIQTRWAAAPDLDSRSADEILGYDENGLPT
ncbi:MAG: type II toxin-antitoxin system VapB family antitoxin [Sphingomonas bacterium]|nr:type II toxin-antitoxin system VapB family antitoxin [Sphingomonas bacterium]